MVDVGTIDIFDAEIVDAQGKDNWAGSVSPKAGKFAVGIVSVGGKEVDEIIEGKAGSLFKAIHSFANLAVDIAIRFDKVV